MGLTLAGDGPPATRFAPTARRPSVTAQYAGRAASNQGRG